MIQHAKQQNSQQICACEISNLHLNHVVPERNTTYKGGKTLASSSKDKTPDQSNTISITSTTQNVSLKQIFSFLDVKLQRSLVKPDKDKYVRISHRI